MHINQKSVNGMTDKELAATIVEALQVSAYLDSCLGSDKPVSSRFRQIIEQTLDLSVVLREAGSREKSTHELVSYAGSLYRKYDGKIPQDAIDGLLKEVFGNTAGMVRSGTGHLPVGPERSNVVHSMVSGFKPTAG